MDNAGKNPNNNTFATYLKNNFCKNYTNLTSKDIDIIRTTFFPGYENMGLCVAFPYMIPDNSSDIVSILFSKLLFKNTTIANKGLDRAYQFDDAVKIRRILEETNQY